MIELHWAVIPGFIAFLLFWMAYVWNCGFDLLDLDDAWAQAILTPMLAGLFSIIFALLVVGIWSASVALGRVWLNEVQPEQDRIVSITRSTDLIPPNNSTQITAICGQGSDAGIHLKALQMCVAPEVADELFKQLANERIIIWNDGTRSK